MRVRDLDDAEYQRRMESLSRTFDMASRVLTSRGPSELDSFMAKYNIHATCPRAVIRLIKGDVDVGPSTGGGGGCVRSYGYCLRNCECVAISPCRRVAGRQWILWSYRHIAASLGGN